MSIRQVQTKSILELILQSFLINGINPQLSDSFVHLNAFFAKQRAGMPYVLDVHAFKQNLQSDPDLMNDFFAYMIVNIDTLYETCFQQIDEIMMLNTLLRTHLERLKSKREILSSKLDDYLLGIFNTDGYFYSFSDDFGTTGYTDFVFTSATVDVLADIVSLSPISSLSVNLTPEKITEPTITVTDKDNKTLPFQVKTRFANAIDGLTNTAWFFEVKTQNVGPITATLSFSLAGGLAGDNALTEINVTPYGVTEVQCGINASYVIGNQTIKSPFCNKIQTSTNKMKFNADQTLNDISNIEMQLIKFKPDYILNDNNNKNINVYVFGFKELLVAEQYYDPTGSWISQPIGLPDELADEMVIDAISLSVVDYQPTNSSITYFIAEDNEIAESISDFNWKQITPISSQNQAGNTIIHFDGSSTFSKMVRKTKRSNSDIQLFDLDNTNVNLASRNPTSAFLPGLDVYRICEFKDEFLHSTLSLEEGVNTTRLFYIDYDADAIDEGLSFWATKFDSGSYSVTYGEIDSGHDFFYGADIGEDNKSIYVETFIETAREYPVFLKECRKMDANSKLWDVRIFLNGREIANMPSGVDRMTVPWKLKEGRNSIIMLVNIPEATSSNITPYLGSIKIMADAQITDYGIVKLANWTYVDLYKFQNNQINEPFSFTIYNNQIISRRKPTNNFRLSFKQKTSVSPEAIRLRADLSRSGQNAGITPILDSYRLRFSYR